MQSQSLSLVVTDLLGHPDVNKLETFPSIEMALARAKSSAVAGVWESIGRAFGFNKDGAHGVPYAALTRLADSGEWAPRQGWLRADPVPLYADATRLVLFDPSILQMSQCEADALAASFRQMYAAEGYALETPTPSRWYLRVPNVDAFQTTPLLKAVGSDLHVTLPSGTEGAKLRALLNEVQMLFHEHPVNQARAATARPLISGIWLWGEGIGMPHISLVPATVYAEDPYSRGLAHLAGSAVADLPGDIRGWLERGRTESDLIVMDREAGWRRYDPAEWSRAAGKLETDWFAPLIAALRDGQLEQLLIYPGNGRCYRLTRGYLRRLWRRPRALAHWAGSERAE